MHIEKFIISCIGLVSGGLSLIFWQLQEFNLFLIFLALALIGNVVLASIQEDTFGWAKNKSNKVSETLRMARVVALFLWGISLIAVVVFSNLNFVKEEWQNGKLNTFVLFLSVFSNTCFAVSAVPNILAVTNKEIFKPEQQIEAKSVLSFNAVYNLVLSAFIFPLIFNISDIAIYEKNNDNWSHLVSSLLVVDIIFWYIKTRYVKSKINLRILLNASGRLVLYVLIWRRIHLANCLEEMKFYGNDFWWLIVPATVFLSSSILIFIKKQKAYSMMATLIVLGITSLSVFFVSIGLYTSEEVILCSNTSNTSLI